VKLKLQQNQSTIVCVNEVWDVGRGLCGGGGNSDHSSSSMGLSAGGLSSSSPLVPTKHSSGAKKTRQQQQQQWGEIPEDALLQTVRAVPSHPCVCVCACVV